eukprot:NODE_15616_length_1040_cov_7.703176.p2 GENE.NODE_15616_length_1040_cov_7.703176~~NODE_15616_length_1040_cov_7.703176.p2  ORF type:complete len:126 (-),score=32.59 NODE_15616_length_1040_cov_7.703176:37-414(-)
MAQAINFLDVELPSAAQALGYEVCGPVFQAMLARSIKSNLGHSLRPGSDRSCSVGVKSLCPDEVARLIAGAEELCALLRIKIEDDGDLGIARRSLLDGREFFTNLAACARRKGNGAWEQFVECRG